MVARLRLPLLAAGQLQIQYEWRRQGTATKRPHRRHWATRLPRVVRAQLKSVERPTVRARTPLETAAQPESPVLRVRAENEVDQIARVESLSDRVAIVPLLSDEPVGVERLGSVLTGQVVPA